MYVPEQESSCVRGGQSLGLLKVVALVLVVLLVRLQTGIGAVEGSTAAANHFEAARPFLFVATLTPGNKQDRLDHLFWMYVYE